MERQVKTHSDDSRGLITVEETVESLVKEITVLNDEFCKRYLAVWTPTILDS